ncbi:PLP-dependent aminotransferase family protein [Cohnella faecalis]|uniref:PLP-dependent aminotransferase family protein n=1 Tax=Cohnella faecalis TaxID=2315694 RepID=A0A398CX10_9BACL|nr:PLP-dependent aminotransferase family protein [Cohnella faecalis]RIE05118.1 PLP-dependent aminotransferase family protein [Cohnella faecalis]
MLIPPPFDGSSNEPSYMRIYRFYREQILLGAIPRHAKLPSIRALAQHLGLSRNPVETAYAHLVAEGYVVNKEKSGYFAVELERPPSAEAPPASPADLLAGSTKTSADDEPIEPIKLDFSHDSVNMDLFPLRLWKQLSAQALREADRSLFHYGDGKGEPYLRNLIRSLLRQNRGVVCEPEQVIVTSGTQQSILILSSLIRSERGKLAVEAAMHPGIYRIFRQQHLRPVPIPLEEDGLSCDTLLTQASLSGVYVTPSHQLPYGTILPAAKRAKLLQWANRTNGWIIEDDYDSEFIYEGRPLPALQGMDKTGRVIYLGTFSKALAPAVRLSYLVLPPVLLERFDAEFAHYDQTASRLTQKTMELFIAKGHLDRHIRKMRKSYDLNRKTLIAAIETHFQGQANVSGASSGLHLLLRVHSNEPMEELVRRAAACGIKVDPASRYHVSEEESSTVFEQPGSPFSSFVMGFGGLTSEQIELGIRTLASVWTR